MIDVRHRVTSEEVVAGALTFFNQQKNPLIQFGLNPHAPYTASLLLYRLAHACASQNGMLLTSHVAESMEETDMFAGACGALHDFLAGLGRPMHDCGLDTPFGWLWRNSAIGPDWILAHLNDLHPSDFSLLFFFLLLFLFQFFLFLPVSSPFFSLLFQFIFLFLSPSLLVAFS